MAVVVLFGLAGCTGDDSIETSAEDSTDGSQVVEDTALPSTERGFEPESARESLPDASEVGTIINVGGGKSVALCGPGEEINSYGGIDERDSSEVSGYANARQAADEFLDSVRDGVSPRNPSLQQLSPEAKDAYLDRFEKYYQPAKTLSVSESRIEGAMTVFVEPMVAENYDAFTWSSVRIEMHKNSYGLFELLSASICGRQLYDVGALTDPIDFASLPNRTGGENNER